MLIHERRPRTLLLLAPGLVLAFCLDASMGVAETFDGALETSRDRWNYGFNTTPGSRNVGSAFGYTGTLFEFDNRDGQVVVGFDTSGLVPTGQGEQYVVESLEFTMTVSKDFLAGYDPTVDSWRTHLPTDDPDYQPDKDPGRPVELFATGFRGPYSNLTWTEETPFSESGAFGYGVRYAYAAQAETDGSMTDASNCVFDGFTARSLGVGTIDGLGPGAVIPEGSVFRFSVDVDGPGVQAWLAAGLDEGLLNFTVSSLVEAEQQGGDFIEFYMRENPLVMAGVRSAAMMSINGSIQVGCNGPGDLNRDCTVDGADIGLFLSAWGTDDDDADLNGDNMVDGVDLGLLLAFFD
ncbi:MAG: hypothetical protein MK085_02450 [Phycisphaerales bacterium]|nr:hypothetical protein [Phycisphaerales bacterium]